MNKDLFNYNGFTEECLMRISDPSKTLLPLCPSSSGITDFYSQARIFREYARFPEWLPLRVVSDHGVGDNKAQLHEIENSAQCMFVFSDEKMQDYKNKSSRPCYKVPHPFIWYRRHRGIKQSPTAKGTLAFVSHSTPWVDCDFDVDLYIDMLKELPAHMHPICACIYVTDVQKGLHKKFIRRGIPVYSAGSQYDERFVDRYYEILRHFKYTTSNEPSGSYSYYSVEMGIPFSGYGPCVKYYNHSGTGQPLGELPFYMLEGGLLFSGVFDSITKEQQTLINKAFDFSNVISPSKMRRILFDAYKAGGVNIKEIRRGLRKKMRRFMSELLHPHGLFD